MRDAGIDGFAHRLPDQAFGAGQIDLQPHMGICQSFAQSRFRCTIGWSSVKRGRTQSTQAVLKVFTFRNIDNVRPGHHIGCRNI